MSGRIDTTLTKAKRAALDILAQNYQIVTGNAGRYCEWEPYRMHERVSASVCHDLFTAGWVEMVNPGKRLFDWGQRLRITPAGRKRLDRYHLAKKARELQQTTNA